MTPERWAMLTIDYELTATGFIITITTNVPCHLWLRKTDKTPGIHHVPILQRGIFLHTDIRICFVAWEDNEQEEAGDTLTHTFIKEPWAHCETRWFYFHGTINGNDSPSTSPIFSKHRFYEAPPFEHEAFEGPFPHVYYLASPGQVAQTFTPQGNYIINLLQSPLNKPRDYNDGIWHVQLRPTLNEKPTEEVLGEATIPMSALLKAPLWDWKQFPMPNIPVLKDVKYAVVQFRTDYKYTFWNARTLSDDIDPYTRGQAMRRSSPVSDWSEGAGIQDMGFRT